MVQIQNTVHIRMETVDLFNQSSNKRRPKLEICSIKIVACEPNNVKIYESAVFVRSRSLHIC